MTTNKITPIINLPFPLQRVWQAVIQPQEMSRWFSDRVYFELAVGSEIVFEGDKYGRSTSIIETIHPPTATEFAEELPMTRQGITKHLKILAEANLVTVRKEGREQRYTLSPQPLAGAAFWVTAVTQQWQQCLQVLYAYLAETENPSTTDEGE